MAPRTSLEKLQSRKRLSQALIKIESDLYHSYLIIVIISRYPSLLSK